MPRSARVEDHDWLSGVWLRPGTDPIFFAPAILPDGRLALCQVDLRYDEDRHQVAHWALYRRGDAVLEDHLEPRAVAAWQALAAVERALEGAGIRLAGGAQQGRLPTE